MDIRLEQLKCVYFIGIGGIGMSAIARYFNGLGIHVAGYDKTRTTLTKQLEEEGMQIHYNEDLDALPTEIDLVVYTPAIPKEHKELQYLQEETTIPLLKRAAVLGLVSKNKKTIGVAGTHGKTTTSSILTHLLRSSGIDCTAFLGGVAQNLASNFVSGNSEWVVMEADEFDRSFLHLRPSIGVITSVDPDHLDIYGEHEEMLKSFNAYAQQVTETIYTHNQIGEIHDLSIDCKKYGKGYGDSIASNIRIEEGVIVFDYTDSEVSWKALKFTLAGEHNVENATVAIAIARSLGATEGSIRKALLSFKGILRRFERIVQMDSIAYIDDYAHHPTELVAAIKAAKQLYPNRELTGMFQPHLYSRTRDFASGFAEALSLLDKVILLDIYPAREKPIEGVTSKIIFDKIKHNNKVLLTKNQLLGYLEEEEKNTFWISLGAGDIGAMVTEIGEIIKSKLSRD